MKARRALRAAAGVVTVVAAIAASAILWHNLPTNKDVQAPFDVHGVAGTPVSGRALSASVVGLRVAPEVVPPESPRAFTASGVWLVVEATITAANDPVTPHADLMVGDANYVPSDRLPPLSQLGGVVQPGIPQRGVWVFDVAPALLKDAGRVTLRVWTGDGRLDSRLDIGIGTEQAYRLDTTKLDRPVEVVP